MFVGLSLLPCFAFNCFTRTKPLLQVSVPDNFLFLRTSANLFWTFYKIAISHRLYRFCVFLQIQPLVFEAFVNCLLCFSPPVFLTAGNKKTAAIFLRKITTAEFFCDESQFRWIATENIIPMQMSTYGITSKQVLWLASYRLKSPHFYILPSQFPND